MADKEFDILLAVKSDTSGLGTVTAQIQASQTELQRQAELSQQIIAYQKDQDLLMAQILGTTQETTVATVELAEASALTGLNLNKAKGEALVLSREIATGNVSMRTAGALLGSLGTAFSVAAIAGFSIYEAVTKIGTGMVKDAQEAKKLSDEIASQVLDWQRLANAADKFGDVSKLTEKIGPELAAATAKFSDFRRSELSAWQTFVTGVGELLGSLPGLGAVGGAITGAVQGSRDQDIAARLAALRTQSLEARAAEDQAKAGGDEWAEILSGPLDEGITKITGKISDLKARLDQLKGAQILPANATSADLAIFTQANTEAAQVNEKLQTQQQHLKAINDLQDKRNKLGQEFADQEAKLSAKGGSPEEIAAAAADKAYDDAITKARQLEALTQKQDDGERQIGALRKDEVDAAERIRSLTYQTVLDQEQHKQAVRATREEVEAESEALKDSALHLQAIKASLSLIGSDPFMTAADKARLQYQLLEQTIKIIVAEITQLKSQIAGGFFDPQHIDQARQKLVSYQVELTKTQQEAAKLGGGLKSDLMEWVNSFGTASHQIASLITDTIGGAIQSLSSGISGLIFGTQTLAQAALQFGEQFVTSLIRIGLQMLAQFLLGQALGEASAAAASAIATPIALAYAPAAALASTASYGGAAVAGQAALTESVLAAKGLASLGGFEQGGYTGPAGGVVHGNEYVIDSTSLGRAGGPAFFDNLRVALNQRGGPRGATSPGAGGPTGGGHHFYLFTDRESLHKHWQSNPTSKKTVIDWVNSAGGHLRT